MRLLADENIPLPSVHLLRSAGCEIAAVGEFAPGSDDETVLAFAAEHAQVLTTMDRDFGDSSTADVLAFRRGSSLSVSFLRIRKRLAAFFSD